MNLINWRNEWQLLVETIKRQDFEHVLEKANREDLILTVRGVAITSIATSLGAIFGGLAYGPLGAIVGSTSANMISYGVNHKYKSVYELIKQLSSIEKYQLLRNIKAVLGGVFNEQTIILGAVVVAKEIYKYLIEIKRPLSSSNNFMIIKEYDK